MNLKDMLSENLQMKFLSLLLAVALWLFVILETGAEIEIPLAVIYVNIPVGLTVKSDSGSGSSLRVEGPRILLIRQKLTGVSVRLDLSGASEGRIDYQGIERLVRLIQGVKASVVSPQKAELILSVHQ